MRVLACLLALLLALPAPAARSDAPTTTVLLYLCGTDLETDNGSASADLAEIMAAGLSADGPVRVLAETGGARQWEMDGISRRVNQRHLVDGEGLRTLDVQVGSRNMGDAETLADFITYGYRHYAADRMVLVLWDHGGGPVSGLCYDENHGNDALNMAELMQALEASVPAVKPLDAIVFDACLMNSAEIAAACAPHARYMVASQETVSGRGLDYAGWLGGLAEDPATDIESLCAWMADSYIDAVGRGRHAESSTMSVIDLAQIDAVTGAVNALGEALSALMDAGKFKNVSRARQSMMSFGEFIDEDASDLVDVETLCDALHALAGPEAEALRDAASAAVVHNATSRDLAGDAHGLSVFFPYSTAGDADAYIRAYQAFSFLAPYGTFVAELSGRMTGGSYAFADYTPQNLYTNGGGTGPSGAFVGLWSQLQGIAGAEGTSGAAAPLSGLWAGLTGQEAEQILGGMEDSGFAGLWGGLLAQETSAPSVPGGLWAGLSPTSAPEAAQEAPAISGGLCAGLTAPTGGTTNLWTLAEDSGADTGAVFAGLWDALAQTGEAYYQPGEQNDNLPAQGAESIAEVAGAYFTSSPLEVQSIYSIQLTRDELDHLAAARSILAAERGGARVRLGELGITEIDWETGMVYSLFDGLWPTLEGQMLCMAQTEAGDGWVRGVAPAEVDGVPMYLVLSLEDGRGEVLGATSGYDAQTGAPSRGLTPLLPGQTVTPLFEEIGGEGGAGAMARGEAIVVGENGLTLAFGKVSAGAYLYGFCLDDIYGQAHYTELVSVTF